MRSPILPVLATFAFLPGIASAQEKVLTCSTDGNDVHLAWTASDGGESRGWVVLRDGRLLVRLDGADREYMDLDVAEGQHRYELQRIAEDGAKLDVGSCLVIASDAGLRCSFLNDTRSVVLEWEIPAGLEIVRFLIRRNGEPYQFAPPDMPRTVDTRSLYGTTRYSVEAVVAPDYRISRGVCTVSIDPSAWTSYLRGDADGDMRLDLTDAVFTWNYFFLGEDEPPCLDAADFDADGIVDIGDPIYALHFLFLGGPSPEAPWPACESGARSLECKQETCPPRSGP